MRKRAVLFVLFCAGLALLGVGVAWMLLKPDMNEEGFMPVACVFLGVSLLFTANSPSS